MDKQEQEFYYTPIFMDWGLFDVIKVRVLNPAQIGFMDYPDAPYLWVEDVERAHTVHGNFFLIDWHRLYLTKEEAEKHGPEICKNPFNF